MEKLSPKMAYKAFLDQSNFGDSRWWTWLMVFWFAVTLWFYGQIIFGIPMFGAAMFSDPQGTEAFMNTMSSNSESANPNAMVAFVIACVAPVFAFIFWAFRNMASPPVRRILLTLASLCAILSFSAIVYSAREGSTGNESEMLGNWIAQSPLVYLFMLLMFPPLAIGLWMGQKYIHKRTILSLHTAATRFRWKRLFFSMLVFWAIAGALTFIGHVSGNSEADFVFDASRFWMYLPITLLFIPLQSATEEIALRGYLNQGLGRYIKSPWIVFIITSAAFASLHLGNPEVAEGTQEASIFVAISGYFFFGMFACLLTYIDGGLETAIGVHAANNMFAAAIVGYESSALPTPTVFRVGLNTELDSITTVIALSLVCLIMYITRKPFEIAKPAVVT